MFTATRFGAVLFTAVMLAYLSWPATAAPLLNGIAIHSELGQEQFIAALYSDDLSTEPGPLLTADVNKRIQVRVLADDLSSRRFKRMWIEGIAINSSYNDLQANAQNMADFSNMLRVKLIKGDILTIDRDMNEGLTVSLNGTTLGKIDNRQFFDLLLRTWIGSVPLSSTFRDNLLQAGEVESDLFARFEATHPTDQRIASVEQAIAASNKEKAAEAKPAVAAITEPVKELVKAPKLEEPTLAMVPPKISAPPKPKPKPKQAKPDQVAKAKPQKPAPAKDVILEDEQEEAFTAASLLSRQLYIGKVKGWAQRELTYPERALRREWEGNVRLDITLDRNGELVDVTVTEEAEHSVLTKEALRAVREASPFPTMPDDVAGDTFLFTLPVAFKLQ